MFSLGPGLRPGRETMQFTTSLCASHCRYTGHFLSLRPVKHLSAIMLQRHKRLCKITDKLYKRKIYFFLNSGPMEMHMR